MAPRPCPGFLSHRPVSQPKNQTKHDFNPQKLFQDHSDALHAYARQRLHRHELCEDVVQETLLAAIQAADTFAGRSQQRTWLIGILRHKIADHFRKASTRHETPLSALRDGQGTLGLYSLKGKWHPSPKSWGNAPNDILEREDFWRIYEVCRSKLPPTLAQCYVLRELEEIPPAEVCKILDISPTNLSVRMHRARLLLRHCLETNWLTD
jgi:RNA polymerase sigma-70 factor, ECF subfamily